MRFRLMNVLVRIRKSHALQFVPCSYRCQKRNAFPHQEKFFVSPTGCGSYDYDCNAVNELRWGRQGACRCSASNDAFCVSGTCELVEGWESSQIPACGATGIFIAECERAALGCNVKTETRKQECR